MGSCPAPTAPLPGGHTAPGEDARQAAAREIAEETGFRVPAEALPLLGWERFTLHEVPPASYPYPFPVSYALMFTARTEHTGTPVEPPPDSECEPAGWAAPAQVPREGTPLRQVPSWLTALGSIGGRAAD
ncbi:NUDIX hydrolase [Streptomyces sp. NPDC057950]|uniref:NUDIX hydrolase n=1 Tax=Streptomyces sp. NPDC057950 TaxID=3346288 RepID=UPI0036DFCF14